MQTFPSQTRERHKIWFHGVFTDCQLQIACREDLQLSLCKNLHVRSLGCLEVSCYNGSTAKCPHMRVLYTSPSKNDSVNILFLIIMKFLLLAIIFLLWFHHTFHSIHEKIVTIQCRTWV